MVFKILSWLGSIASIAGSFAVSLMCYRVGFPLFILGSLSWLLVAKHNNDKPLFIMQLVFFLANLIGLYNAYR